MAILEVREARLTIKVVELLKWNREFLKAKKKDKAEVDTKEEG